MFYKTEISLKGSTDDGKKQVVVWRMTYRPGKTDGHSDGIQKGLRCRVINKWQCARVSERRRCSTSSEMLKVYRVVAERLGDKQPERARLIWRDVDRVMAQADTEEGPTWARTTAVDIAARWTGTAITVSGATVVVMVAPQTNLELARSCNLDTQHIQFRERRPLEYTEKEKTGDHRIKYIRWNVSRCLKLPSFTSRVQLSSGFLVLIISLKLFFVKIIMFWLREVD